ncbi:MAG: hypothetical protein ACRDBL_04710 [Rhabdaerophilum sp.]
MAITSADQFFNAMGNNNSPFTIDKAAIGNAAANQLFSLWRATGQPAQGAIPGAAAVPNNATTGAITFTQQNAPATSYLGSLVLNASNNATAVELYDRIAHMAGLVLNVTTAQPITGLDLQTLAPPAARLGAANYSDGAWFLEVYGDGGATASNATINVTYHDGTTGNLTLLAVGGTLRAGRLIALTPLIPVADQGKFIRAINSVTLSASTTVAGNFGFTYLRYRGTIAMPISTLPAERDFLQVRLEEIPNGTCLQMVCLCSTTQTGSFRGFGKIAHG